MVYEDFRDPDISPSKEIIGTSIFTVSMVALILFVLTAFIL